MHRISTMATTAAATMVITDYLALAVVLASMLALSLDNVIGALLMAALVGYMAPAITSEARSAEPRLGRRGISLHRSIRVIYPQDMSGSPSGTLVNKGQAARKRPG